jgi:hypothetical protein
LLMSIGAGNEDSKGYCYSEASIGPVYESLDSTHNEPNGGVGYRLISSNWYIYRHWSSQ